MPAESDSDEDWFDRRRRLDTSTQADHHHVQRPPIHNPLQLARSQAFSMAGIPPSAAQSQSPTSQLLDAEYGGDAEHLYRPVSPGKALHMPMADPRRTLYRPAELDDYERMGYAPPQRLLQRREHLADQLVGSALGPGLGRYMDPQLVAVGFLGIVGSFK